MKFNPQEKITNLRGKQYLEVKWRLVWFREEHPKGAVTTEVLTNDPLMLKATVKDENGLILATGHGSAEKKAGAVWSGRELEKAETAAIGRALAHAGYGTQFTEDDEEGNLADSPVERKPAQPAAPKPADYSKVADANGELYSAKTAEQLQKIVTANAAPAEKIAAAKFYLKQKEGK